MTQEKNLLPHRTRLLALDTSSKSGALVALEWEPGTQAGFSAVRLVSEWALSVDASFHSEKLLWGVHQMLEACGWKISDVDVFGVGVGPGSFTGLRIGMTTARTLAKTLGKPLIGVSSLAALARPVAHAIVKTGEKAVVIASTDACKGELYALFGLEKPVSECVSFSQGDLPGLWKRGVVECVIEPEDLLAKVQKKLSTSKSMRWVSVGEGLSRYPEISRKLPRSRELKFGLPFSDSVQGRYLGALAWEAYQAGLARDPLLVHPRYLRVSDAEMKLQAGLLPPGPTRSGTA